MREKQDGVLISIIVAAYNIEEYLPRCLESLLTQSYGNIEIIVVDDGSRDNTGLICDQYAQKDKRVKVIHQKNQGLSGARNSGLLKAKGDFIGYVDGDDWVERDMYRDMLMACQDSHAQMAVCAYRKTGPEAEVEVFSGEIHVLTRKEALEIYICDNREYHIYNSVWSKLFCREAVKDLKFPAGRKSEDIVYTTRALLNIDTCVFLDTPYYNYMTDREDSIMNQGLGERRFKDEIPFWKEQLIYLENAGEVELAHKAAYQFYRRMLFYYVDFRDRKMNTAGRELVRLLRKEQKEISGIYRKDFVKTGDKVRMGMALVWPFAYYLTVKFYEKYVIPLRHK